MADYYQPSLTADSRYTGLTELFGYINADGDCKGTNCGLAASATLLTYMGGMRATMTPSPLANPNLAVLESQFPPNILGGLAGTSRGRVERILDAFGYHTEEVAGEVALRAALQKSEPVAVMLQIPGKTVMGIQLPGGHWMVAYGYDAERIYLTNWHDFTMSWDEFRRGWSGWIPWCINMERKGLVAKARS